MKRGRGFLKRVNLHLLSYALLQVTVGGSALLRVPIVLSNSELSVTSQFLLFVSVLAWAPLIVSGIVNRSRVTFVQTGKISVVRLRLFSKSFFFILFVLLTAIFLALFGNSGLLPAVLLVVFGLALPVLCSPFYGMQQGAGRINTQYLTSALAAAIGLLLTAAVVLSSFWKDLARQEQIFVLVSISVTTNSVPYLMAYARYRKSDQVVAPADGTSLSFVESAKRFKSVTLESAATLPPILLGLVDVIALSVLREQEDVISYGLTQRISVIATFLIGALYLRELNKTVSEIGFNLRDALNRSLKLAAKNLPFLGVFMLATPWLVSTLSQNQVSASTELVVSFGFLAIGQAFWVVFSGYVYKTTLDTQQVGKFILFILLPTSVAVTFGGALAFGPSGPAWASLICYIFAVLYSGWRLGRKSND